MVKKMVVVISVIVYIFGIAASAGYAGCGCQKASSCGSAVKTAECAKPAPAGDVCNGPARKLGRGLSNCVTFPLELFEQPKRINNSDGPMAAVTYGVVKGVIMTVFRAVVGVYETGTFLIPLPQGYEPILTDPEFFLEQMTY